jgi:hypothetical protein
MTMTDMNMEDEARYIAAAHAMQSGVAMEMNYRSQPTEPKHLRVGINSAMVDHSALAKILIDKGIITDAEYMKALADAMEAEKLRYEKHISELVGRKVTLE